MTPKTFDREETNFLFLVPGRNYTKTRGFFLIVAVILCRDVFSVITSKSFHCSLRETWVNLRRDGWVPPEKTPALPFFTSFDSFGGATSIWNGFIHSSTWQFDPKFKEEGSRKAVQSRNKKLSFPQLTFGSHFRRPLPESLEETFINIA